MLSEIEISQLEELLFEPQWSEGAMDFFGFHGAICAAVVGPAAIPPDLLFAVVTGQDLAKVKEVPGAFQEAATKLGRQIRSTLEQGDALELPEPEDGDPGSALENWCAGFMDAFLLQEDEWLKDHEEDVAGRLVPIMTLSNLFEDDDFQRVRQDQRMADQMADQIPDTLTDLYLLFHTP